MVFVDFFRDFSEGFVKLFELLLQVLNLLVEGFQPADALGKDNNKYQSGGTACGDKQHYPENCVYSFK